MTSFFSQFKPVFSPFHPTLGTSVVVTPPHAFPANLTPPGQINMLPVPEFGSRPLVPVKDILLKLPSVLQINHG